MTAGPAGRVVIVGGGHNGLVAAAFLARAGLRPLVLERRRIVGGAAVTEEIHPGFRCPTLAHSAGPLLPGIARELELARHGLEWLRPEVRVFAPSPDGRALLLHDDPARTLPSLAAFSAADAKKFPDFHLSLGRIGRVLAELFSLTPPDIDRPGAGSLWSALGVGRKFRALPRRDAYRLLRWGPMAVADLVSEWFETDLLRAAIAARGIAGMFGGPWSAGSGANLLLQAALDGHSAGPAAFPRGGIGALTEALASAARDAGAEIRTGAGVARIAVEKGAATGVVLESGEAIPARAVVSNADPRRTFLRLLDPTDLDPDFLEKVRNYRSTGVAAKVNLALSGLPSFPALASAGKDGSRAALSGRIHIGPGIDYLERSFDAAKYGDFSPEPWCEVTIPSIADPSLAPSGGHVLSVYAQYAPHRLREGSWTERREALGDAVVRTLAAYAPDLPGKVVARRVLTPLDLEEEYGLTGGHGFHGEHSLDQLFTMRPVLGHARYRTPVAGLYLCGAGTHPGGGVTGGPGRNASREIVKDLRRAR